MKGIVLGAGDIGMHVASELSSQGNEVTLIDERPEALTLAEESLDVRTLLGNGTHRSVLQEAEVRHADLVVAVTHSDEANVVCAALASALGARRSVAQVDDPNFYQTQSGLETGVLGIHALLCLSQLVSKDLLRLIEKLDTSYIGNFAGGCLQVCAMPLVGESMALGHCVADLKLDEEINAVGIVRDALLRLPEEIERLETEDILMFSGPPRAVARTVHDLRANPTPRRAVVVGGGEIGFQLCRTLASTEKRVQLIEQNRPRAEYLSTALSDVEVLHGDGKSIACLRDEQIDAADYLIATTHEDEVNLMASLMGKTLGVPHTFSLVHKPGYSDIYTHLGIHGTTGTHNVIAKTVRWLCPRKGAAITEMLMDSGHHLFEFQLGEELRPSATLHDLALPPDACVAGLVRGNHLLKVKPTTPLQPFDDIVIIAPLPKRAMERCFSKRGEMR